MGAPPAPPSRVRWDIVEEHLDEAEFLFEQWTSALESSTRGLDRIAMGAERRLIAHVDALAVGEAEVADGLLWPALAPEAESAARVTAATLALLVAPGPTAIDRVLELAVTLPPGACHDGIVAALSIAARADVSGRVASLAERTDDAGRWRLVPVFANRGGIPGPNLTATLLQAHAQAEPALREAAARAAMHLARPSSLHVVERMVGDADPCVHAAALRSAIAHGSSGAYARAFDLVRARLPCEPPVLRAAMECLAAGGEAGPIGALVDRLGDAALRPDAIWALGLCGRADMVDRLIPWLGDDACAALAGEAIGGITGLGHEQPQLFRERPPEPPPPDGLDEPLPAEDLDAAPVAPGNDELPLPDPQAFAKAWASARTRFDPRVRVQLGRPLASLSDWLAVLAASTMRRRAPIAFEIAMRTRGVRVAPVRTLSVWQRAQLQAWPGSEPVDGNRPFARISG